MNKIEAVYPFALVNPKLKPTGIQFTEEADQRIITKEQNIRVVNNIHSRNYRIDTKRNDKQVSDEGVIGEAATYRMFGVPICDITKNRGRDVPDLVWLNNTISIKSMGWSGGHLIYPDHQELHEEFAFLVLVLKEEWTAWILGWINNADYHRLRWRHNFGHGDQWCVSQKELRPNFEFFRLARVNINLLHSS